jgi:hypothetical protein
VGRSHSTPASPSLSFPCWFLHLLAGFALLRFRLRDERRSVLFTHHYDQMTSNREASTLPSAEASIDTTGGEPVLAGKPPTS